MTAGLVTAVDLKAAVQATMLTHLPAALVAVCAGRMPDARVLPMPASYAAPTMEALRRDTAQLPAMVVTTDGTGPFRRDEAGVYTAVWAVAVGFIVRSDEGTYEATDRDTQLYAAAIRTVLIERSALGGIAKSVTDIDESYAEGPAVGARTLGEGVVGCSVEVFDAARRGTAFTDPQAVPVVGGTTIHIGPPLTVNVEGSQP